uniref:Fibroblast growth factor n=1 Tax=Strongyloides venezuelensis TaxID=75913 RepID=A0A0K0FCN4_STRVS
MNCVDEKPSISGKIERETSKDACLSKSIVIDENIGNRKKNRIVCETSADSISPNVSYSLNRKNRWDTITPMSLNINAINCIPKDMTVAVVEQMNTIPDIGCVNEKINKHFIRGFVTCIITNEDGYIKMKNANGPPRAHLSSFLRNKQQNFVSHDLPNNDINYMYDTLKRKTQVSYHINTPQNNTDYSIGEHFRRQLNMRLKEKTYIGKTYRKVHNKSNIDITEINNRSEDVSETEEFNSDSESVASKFPLADFIQELSPITNDKQSVYIIDRLIPSNNNKLNT